jgi:tetratricopeptide (TPR) repeat protein
MQPVPRIFVSATSRDLRTARALVSEGLRRMECLPIVQDDFPPDYKSVRDMLRTKIQACDAVVHLAGFYYGAEPQPVLPGPDRRSFTQMEYEIAMELKLPCYVFLCGKDFPFDTHDPETEDKQALQMAHRDHLLKRDELFYEFATPEELANRTRELQLSVEGLRGELAKERSRRRLTLAGCLVLFLIGGGYFYSRMQKSDAVNVQQTSEIAALKAELEGPWAVVSKVNAAMEVVAKNHQGTPDELKTAAIQMVAEQLKKKPAEIEASIASVTNLAEKIMIASRTEAAADPAKREQNRLLQIETLNKLGASHEASGQYKDALAAYQEALGLMDPSKESEEWVYALLDVADTQENLGENAAAGASYRKAHAFALKEPALGLKSAATASATSKLHLFLNYTERNSRAAEDLMRQTLDDRLSALGEDSPKTLEAMSSLAMSLVGNRKFEEAEALCRRALSISTQLFGADHETTLDISGDLSSILGDRGELDEAITLRRTVLAHSEKTLGLDSTLAISDSSLLAGLLEQKGDFDQAEIIRRDVFKRRAESKGADHPDTLFAMNNFALNLQQQKKYKEAEEVYAQLLSQQKKAQGPDHPDTLDALDSLALVTWLKGDLAEAEVLYRQKLEGIEKKLGPDHFQTLQTLETVGGLLSDAKKYDEAEALYLKLLKSRQRTLGDKDPGVADAFHKLARLYADVDRLDEGLEMAQKAVSLADALLDKDDPLRAKYEGTLKRLKNPQPKSAPTPAPKPVEPEDPQFAAYISFRDKVNEELKAEGWKEIRVDLPGADAEHLLYVLGWYDGGTLRKAMRVDAEDNDNGTFTFYYWDGKWMTSAVRIREGRGVPIEGVKRTVDTLNFRSEKLIGWKRAQDELSEMANAKDWDFKEIGGGYITEAKEVMKVLAEAASASSDEPPSTDDYAAFRKALREKEKSENWKKTKLELQVSEPGRSHFIEASWDGDELRIAFEWNALDSNNGTFTTYYFQKGLVTSVFRLREGKDVPIEGVKKSI